MYIAKLLYIAADNTVSVFIVYVAIYQITDSNQKLCDCVCPVYYHVRWLCSVRAVYFLLPASLSDVYQCSQWGRLSTERLLRNMFRFRSEYHHVGSRVVSMLDSGTVGPGFKSQSRRCRVTVHTHRASVHQAVKLVAALLRVAGVTAGLAESNGSLPSGLWFTSPAGWLPRTGISSGTICSVIEYGLPFYHHITL